MPSTDLIYEPVGLDLWERKSPAPGTRVVLVQPGHGAPPNGTWRHAYIADAVTGEFYGLRLLASLVTTAGEAKGS